MLFLASQEIKLSPIRAKYIEVDLLSDRDPAQSASEYYGYYDHIVNLFQENL